MAHTLKVNDRVIVAPDSYGRWGGRIVKDNGDGTYAVAPIAGTADDSCARIDAGRLRYWPDAHGTPHVRPMR